MHQLEAECPDDSVFKRNVLTLTNLKESVYLKLKYFEQTKTCIPVYDVDWSWIEKSINDLEIFQLTVKS